MIEQRTEAEVYSCFGTVIYISSQGDIFESRKIKASLPFMPKGRWGATNVEPVGIDDKEKEFRLLDIDLFQQASI